MLSMLWLAFTAPPIALEHVPNPLPETVVVDRMLSPPQCLLAACLGGEWQPDALASIPAGQRRIDGNDLPGMGGRMRLADQKRRDWMKPLGSNARVGMQYGLQALKTRETSLQVAVDTGYRLQGYADDGIAGTGPILRGQIEWQQALGELPGNARDGCGHQRAFDGQVHRVGQRGYLKFSNGLGHGVFPSWIFPACATCFSPLALSLSKGCSQRAPRL